MLTFFDGLISPSNEKDVPCVYLTMNTLFILGESRGVTPEWHAQGDARARGGIAARSLARPLAARLARQKWRAARRLCAYLFTWSRVGCSYSKYLKRYPCKQAITPSGPAWGRYSKNNIKLVKSDTNDFLKGTLLRNSQKILHILK